MNRLFRKTIGSMMVLATIFTVSLGYSAYAAQNSAYDPNWAQALSQTATEREAVQTLQVQELTQSEAVRAAQEAALAQAQALQAAQAKAAQEAALAQAQAFQAAQAKAAQEAAAAQALQAAQEAAAAQALQAAQAKAAQEAAAVQALQAAQAKAAQEAAATQGQAVPGGTYVDVNIAAQTLTYFVSGTPVIITPCVTGSPGRSTPRGVFAIDTMIPGKYLTGPSWHVWVNRWMRFSGNCGIHDANWRKKFGGDIYLHNGSHGCVNIPYDQATLLYSMVGIGTPVIVH